MHNALVGVLSFPAILALLAEAYQNVTVGLAACARQRHVLAYGERIAPRWHA